MKRAQITIPMGERGQSSAVVDAEVFGAWAVHVSPGRYTHSDRGPPRPATVITHVPTGLRAQHTMLVGVSKRVARKVAVRLNIAFPVLPDDMLAVARGEHELSPESAAIMKRVSDSIWEFVMQAEKKS